MRLSYRTVAMLATGRYTITGAESAIHGMQLANGIGIAQGPCDKAAQQALDWADSCEKRPGVRCTYSVHMDITDSRREQVVLQVTATLPWGVGDPDLRTSWRTFR